MMLPIDSLQTPRLLIRRLRLEDADAMTRLLQVREIAANAAGIPYPFTRRDALDWIHESTQIVYGGRGAVFAVIRTSDSAFIGSLGLTIWRDHRRGEIGYWFGKPYWDFGYATEAARRLVQAGFEELDLNRMQANCYTRNLASARVLQKVGMRYEGTARQYMWNPVTNEFEDLHFYALLRSDFSHAPPA